ncbi:toll/interleukin-1 receptor domain-containing protein, partial [Mariniblastus sp.]|nr:toll/interleukin-1 receptor domain-containing protein [Mariniblastus sp.]
MDMRRAKSSFWERLVGYDFFISHARLDGALLAESIHKTSKSVGLTPFLDTGEIIHSEKISKRVKAGLKRSSILMVLLTKEAYRSKWVAREIQQFGQTRSILPIIIDEPPSDSSPESL